jgi:hypothetical protein
MKFLSQERKGRGESIEIFLDPFVIGGVFGITLCRLGHNTVGIG